MYEIHLQVDIVVEMKELEIEIEMKFIRSVQQNNLNK